MATLRVGVIGCGRPRDASNATGFGMAHWHAVGYESHPDTEIVALADVNLDNAKAFQADHGGDHLYTDYHEMLEHEQLDIVSVCTWPTLHSEMVVAAAGAGARAVHCEKPMAPSLAESREMVDACRASDTQLTFNHQRRFADRFCEAREILRSGAIGELAQLEGRCANLFDWGTHWFDMFGFFNDEQPAAWVLGQIDPRDGPEVFGITMESQAVSHIRYANGVRGILLTGHEAGPGPQIRLVGTEGVVEIGHSADVPVRWIGPRSQSWQSVPVNDVSPGVALTRLGINDLIDSLQDGREPELSGDRALRATEALFATYESSRCRQRVDFPLAGSTRSVTDYVKEVASCDR